MHPAAGVVLIVGGSAAALLTALALWRRLTAVVVLALAAACGAVVGAGALLVQDGVGAGDWVIAIVLLGLLVPLHCRALLGPSGTHTRS